MNNYWYQYRKIDAHSPNPISIGIASAHFLAASYVFFTRITDSMCHGRSV